MADAPAPKAKKKIMGMSYLTVGLGVAGILVAYYLYRRMQASSAAGAANSSTGLAGGNSVPTGQTSGGTSSLPTFSSFSQWEQAVLSGMTGPGYSASQALNDLVGWVSGQCVSAKGYTAIGNAITTQGLPPGFGTSLPPLTVCSSSSSGSGSGSTGSTGSGSSSGGSGSGTGTGTSTVAGPGALPTALMDAMEKNGEHIVQTVYDPVYKDYLYLTNKGGIYTLQPGDTGAGGTAKQATSGFFGSYLGLPSSATQGGPRTFTGVTVNSNGGYTLTSSDGQTYHFGPHTKYGVGASSGSGSSVGGYAPNIGGMG
jgi:hypothetical protein